MSQSPEARQTARKAFGRSALRFVLLALALNFVLETLSRHTPISTFDYMIHRPQAFLYNSLILCCMLSLALLFHRRRFVVVLIGSLWLILGIINCIMHIVRITPLGFYDFVIWLKNTSISNAYVSIGQFVLIGIGVAAYIVGMVILFRRAPKVQPQRKYALLFVLLLWAAAAACTVPYAMANRDYTDPAKAYKRNGFPYSLLRSAVDRGVSRPEKYDKDTINVILTDVQTTPAAQTRQTPNFIFLQLESFLSPDNILSVQCSEDPVPTFTRLKQTCSSGLLYVPMIGGGTANVEFEVITGMKLSDFGTGEYPYSTVLQEATCESVAYDLKALGYAAHAIHSNTATFYQRHLVFPRLGFDTFTSLEYMQDYTTNALGWCRDADLSTPIMDALRADSGPDVIFAISVQGHGMYATDAPEEPYAITSTGLEENPSLKNSFEYYINQLKETDDFLRNLLSLLRACPEPVVLVIYGDHLPALDFSEDDLRSGSLLATEYVIWTNDNSLAKQDRDITSYQLTAYALGRCGISNGVLMRFHQQRAQDENYLEALHQLEYDVLYGDKYLYDGHLPYEPSQMRMGVKPIVLSNALYDGRAIIARGQHFTRASKVFIDSHALTTIYVDGDTLVALPGFLEHVEAGTNIYVGQVATDGTLLSRTDEVACKQR